MKKTLIVLILLFAGCAMSFGGDISSKTVLLLSDRIEAINKRVKVETEALREEIRLLKGQPSQSNIQPKSRSFAPLSNSTNSAAPFIFQPLQLYNKGLSKKEQDAILLILNYTKHQELTESQRKTLKDILENYK